MIFWINGAFKENTQALHIDDRGFLLGDGVFETILLVNGVPAFFTEHVARLKASLKALSIKADIDESIIGPISELVRRNNCVEGVAALRLTVSRGAGGRGLLFSKENVRPTILLTIHDYAPPSAAAIKLMMSNYRRSELSVAARHKTANYIDNLMARNDAAEKGFDEAVMLNSAGRVASASAANIFVVSRKGEVMTPPIREGALPGIVRGMLLENGAVEALVERKALMEGEVFLTNSLMGMRAATLSGKVAVSGVGRELILAYEERLQSDLEKRAGVI